VVELSFLGLARATQPLRHSITQPLLLFVFTLAIHLVYFHYSNQDFFYPDSATYQIPARNLAHGLGFVDEHLAAETMRTPGYPLFLALFGTNMAAVVFVQHLFAALLAAAVFVVALRWSGRRAIALTAALLFALDTPAIHCANKVLTESLFATVFFATFLGVLAVRTNRGAALAGIATGVLVLIRPVAMFWFIVVALYFLISSRRRLIAVYAICALALPLAWGIRNRVRTGVLTVSSIAGANLLEYRAAGALAILDDYDFPDALRDRQNELLEEADELAQRSEHVADAGDLPHAVRSRYLGIIGRRVLLQHPFGAILITLHGFEMNVFDSDWDAMHIVSRVPASILRMSLDALTAIEFLLAICGIAWLWRRDRTLALFIGLTLIYFLGISAGGESEARFRVPMMPPYAIAAALGLRALTK